jgi:hypothetical protein
MAYGILASLLLNKVMGGGGGDDKQQPQAGPGGSVSISAGAPSASDVGGGMLGVDDVMKKRKGQMENEMMLRFLSELLASKIGGL